LAVSRPEGRRIMFERIVGGLIKVFTWMCIISGILAGVALMDFIKYGGG
jgi:hypothetical protein